MTGGGRRGCKEAFFVRGYFAGCHIQDCTMNKKTCIDKRTPRDSGCNSSIKGWHNIKSNRKTELNLYATYIQCIARSQYEYTSKIPKPVRSITKGYWQLLCSSQGSVNKIPRRGV